MNTISQSLLRDMMSEAGYCGHYLNEVYNNGYRTPPTDAMLQGLVFEQAILGATARGEMYEIPKLKSGEKSKAERDLDEVIAYARQVLAANEIVFDEVQPARERAHLSGHIDALGTYHGQPYIFDLKFTGMAYSQWERELKWGNISAHFTLQARQYQAIVGPLPFMFIVFGRGWCRLFELPYDQDAVEHHSEIAAEALETFNAMDYRPTTDSRLCFECRLADVCKVKNININIEQL